LTDAVDGVIARVVRGFIRNCTFQHPLQFSQARLFFLDQGFGNANRSQAFHMETQRLNAWRKSVRRLQQA